ncbi:hypothetical protein EUBDOL_01553 [Amedibacillus dolichus DSM 3991]|uniref:Uncharacterized protein n=1 Tax=Amedibacillus dolichus DSM 3991 TaxID=428127 RepID=A8RD05_9FIRM|nr:hypothetical protein EUBDOL_01553 [Amedibacillus dolichus DSM 3991]DAZ24766.1 MAG TPA: hypothetical protein [Caudoviricetes sp.]
MTPIWVFFFCPRERVDKFRKHGQRSLKSQRTEKSYKTQGVIK